jgi:hypothetical protein
VERKVRRVIMYLGFTKNKDSNFHMIVEFYWHVKYLIAQDMKPQEGEIRNLTVRVDVLE